MMARPAGVFMQKIMQFFQRFAADDMLHFAGVYIGRFGVYSQYLGKKTAQNAVAAAHVFGGAAAFGRQTRDLVW